jgi:hypothetical protein
MDYFTINILILVYFASDRVLFYIFIEQNDVMIAIVFRRT